MDAPITDQAGDIAQITDDGNTAISFGIGVVGAAYCQVADQMTETTPAL